MDGFRRAGYKSEGERREEDAAWKRRGRAQAEKGMVGGWKRGERGIYVRARHSETARGRERHFERMLLLLLLPRRVLYSLLSLLHCTRERSKMAATPRDVYEERRAFSFFFFFITALRYGLLLFLRVTSASGVSWDIENVGGVGGLVSWIAWKTWVGVKNWM